MNLITLSKRLKTVADFVPKNSKMIDVGTDHAYLLIYLAANKIINEGIASEIAEGPLNNAKDNIAKYGLTNIIETRLGDGVETLKNNSEVDVLSINGMGGKTIVHILEEGYEQNKLPKYLVLQPNTDEWQVRFWLNSHNYQITNEKIVNDKKEVYEIIVAKYDKELQTLEHKEIKFGPYLLKERDDLFNQKYQKELKKNEKIIKNIPKNSFKYRYLEEQIKEIKELF